MVVTNNSPKAAAPRPRARVPLSVTEQSWYKLQELLAKLPQLLKLFKWPRRKPSNDGQPPKNPASPPPPKPQNKGTERYEVQDSDGQQVAESATLTKAHEQWKQLTQQQGRIIDRKTGQDVTPTPDDNGRYVVLDKTGKPVGSYDDRSKAETVWREQTNQEGKIIDMQTQTDVTPKVEKPPLTDEQLDALAGMIGGHNASHLFDSNNLSVDPELVAELMRALNKLPVPAYDITNLRGRGRNTPMKTVPIVRRKVEIVTVKKPVEVELPGPRRPSKRIFVPYPTDDPEPTFVRGVKDIANVNPRAYALPTEVFNHRLVGRKLTRRAYQEEIPGEQTVQKRKVLQEFEEPKVTEWTENVEVAEEQQAQLLEVIVDVSGSMDGMCINLAIALACVIIGAHLEDDSRYLYRQFATMVGKLTDAKTPAERRTLMKDLLTQKNDLGGSTNIIPAIAMGADDVRERALKGQACELLLITDGDDDWVTSDSVYEAIGDDVTLHTVIVGGASNEALRRLSTTYYELNGDSDGRVMGTSSRGKVASATP